MTSNSGSNPPASSTASAPAASSATAASAKAPEGGVKDTIESILIAFILAFVFRAFVVEAFVIPTGSMAPTLLGAHIRNTCEDCGYRFTVNYQGKNENDDIVIPRNAGRAYSLVCPNCAFPLRPKDTTNPPVHYGDRILVLKYLYLMQDPARWDVVVFKNPEDHTKQYATNYIKRLVGKPGEAVMILDGDVYVAPKDATNPADFVVQTKPRYVQESLWRIVYDNDYYPRRVDRAGAPWRQPWTVTPNSSGWDLGSDPLTGRTFRFDNPSGGGAIVFDPRANPGASHLTDWLAYDQNETGSGERYGGHSVGDLKLSFAYVREEGDGPLRASLTKLNTTLTAELTPAGVRLLKRVDMGAPVELASVPMKLEAGRSVHVEFTNVDYRATVRVDGKNVIVTTPEQYAPDVVQLLGMYNSGRTQPRPAIQIEASNQRGQVTHLSLWRDVYYINSRDNTELRWGVPRDFPNHVVRLSAEPGREEFYVLGDNSAISGDSRYWKYDVELPAEDLRAEAGRVPGRFMLGKAFFVYWPAGFRPQNSMPGLIPNFGQMRFIH